MNGCVCVILGGANDSPTGINDSMASVPSVYRMLKTTREIRGEGEYVRVAIIVLLHVPQKNQTLQQKKKKKKKTRHAFFFSLRIGEGHCLRYTQVRRVSLCLCVFIEKTVTHMHTLPSTIIQSSIEHAIVTIVALTPYVPEYSSPKIQTIALYMLLRISVSRLSNLSNHTTCFYFTHTPVQYTSICPTPANIRNHTRMCTHIHTQIHTQAHASTHTSTHSHIHPHRYAHRTPTANESLAHGASPVVASSAPNLRHVHQPPNDHLSRHEHRAIYEQFVLSIQRAAAQMDGDNDSSRHRYEAHSKHTISL